jgi:2-methylisocitrate lyase-like PEP mutase family enzyme
MADQATDQKFKLFRALHDGTEAFVMPNPWDAGSARLLAAAGFSALATTSAGYAFSVGKRDSFASLSRDEILENASAIVNAVDVPVSADLEDGFGPAAADCARTIRAASAVGLVGGSIEDATGNADDPIFEFEAAVERVSAAAEAASTLPFVLTARAENFLWGRPDLGDTIKRLQAFGEAGADVLYAPGLPDLNAIAQICRSVDQPVNVVMGLSGPRYTVHELSEAGVRRISVGGVLARAAYGAVIRAAQEMATDGSFGFATKAAPDAEIAAMMSSDKLSTRI